MTIDIFAQRIRTLLRATPASTIRGRRTSQSIFVHSHPQFDAIFAVFQLTRGATTDFLISIPYCRARLHRTSLLDFWRCCRTDSTPSSLHGKSTPSEGICTGSRRGGLQETEMYTSTNFPALKPMSTHTLQLVGAALNLVSLRRWNRVWNGRRSTLRTGPDNGRRRRCRHADNRGGRRRRLPPRAREKVRGHCDTSQACVELSQARDNPGQPSEPTLPI